MQINAMDMISFLINVKDVNIGIWPPSTDTHQVKLVLIAQGGMAKTNNSTRHIKSPSKEPKFCSKRREST